MLNITIDDLMTLFKDFNTQYIEVYKTNFSEELYVGDYGHLPVEYGGELVKSIERMDGKVVFDVWGWKSSWANS